MVLNALTAIWQIVGASLIGVSERRLAQGVSSNFSTYQANRTLLSALVFQVSSYLPLRTNLADTTLGRAQSSLPSYRHCPLTPLLQTDSRWSRNYHSRRNYRDSWGAHPFPSSHVDTKVVGLDLVHYWHAAHSNTLPTGRDCPT